MRSLAGLALGLGICACGPTVEDPDDEPRCASSEPHRVLELDADEVLTSRPTRFGDRVYLTIGDAVTADDVPDDPFTFGPKPPNPRVVSVGACGESPREIADGVGYVRESPLWPGSLIGTSDATGDTMLLDPTGDTPPRLAFPAMRGFSVGTDLGAVYIPIDNADPSHGPLLLQPYPAAPGDPVPPTQELLPDVSTDFGSVAGHGTEVLARTVDGDILALDLGDGSTIALVEGAVAMRLSDDGEWLAFQRATPEGARTTSVLERKTGAVTDVAEGTGLIAFGAFLDDLVVPLDQSPAPVTRVVRLPSLTSFDVPAGVTPVLRLDDGRYLASTQGLFLRYDLETGAGEDLVPGAPSYRLADGVLDTLEGPLTRPFPGEGGGWWRVPLQEGTPLKLAARASDVRGVLPDGRGATLVDIDDAYLGTLVLVEAESIDEEPIDDRVFALGVDIEGGAFGDGVVAYGVRDGERSGVWVVRPGEG